MELKPGEGHGRQERLETGRQRAERIVREELLRLRWKESDLEKQAKGAPEKVAMACRIRTPEAGSEPDI